MNKVVLLKFEEFSTLAKEELIFIDTEQTAYTIQQTQEENPELQVLAVRKYAPYIVVKVNTYDNLNMVTVEVKEIEGKEEKFLKLDLHPQAVVLKYKEEPEVEEPEVVEEKKSSKPKGTK